MGRGYNKEELVSKIEWEGGIPETLEYGVTADDIDDPELAKAWTQLEQMWRQFEVERDRVVELLPY